MPFAFLRLGWLVSCLCFATFGPGDEVLVGFAFDHDLMPERLANGMSAGALHAKVAGPSRIELTHSVGPGLHPDGSGYPDGKPLSDVGQWSGPPGRAYARRFTQADFSNGFHLDFSAAPGLGMDITEISFDLGMRQSALKALRVELCPDPNFGPGTLGLLHAEGDGLGVALPRSPVRYSWKRFQIREALRNQGPWLGTVHLRIAAAGGAEGGNDKQDHADKNLFIDNLVIRGRVVEEKDPHD